MKASARSASLWFYDCSRAVTANNALAAMGQGVLPIFSRVLMRRLTRDIWIVLLALVFESASFAQSPSPTATASASINQRGRGNRSSPAIRAGGAANVMGSKSYTYSVPMFALSGRHGLNLNLSLIYNNLICGSPMTANGVIWNFDAAY